MKILHKIKTSILACSLVLVSTYSIGAETQHSRVMAEKGMDQYSEYLQKNKHRLTRDAKRFYHIGTPYKNYIETVALNKDLPIEVYAIAAMESSYKEKAIGQGKSVGMWQLGYHAAKEMKMTVNNTTDDRKDWKKSTNAALGYIKSNAEKNFGNNYELAVLSYNTGAGKVKRAMKKHNTDNVWSIIQDKEIFSTQEKNYFFKYVAYSTEFEKLNNKNIKVSTR